MYYQTISPYTYKILAVRHLVGLSGAQVATFKNIVYPIFLKNNMMMKFSTTSEYFFLFKEVSWKFHSWTSNQEKKKTLVCFDDSRLKEFHIMKRHEGGDRELKIFWNPQRAILIFECID